VIGPSSRLRLASKVRLRFDPRSGKQVLLYPERGLELSESAARIAALCAEAGTEVGTKGRTVAEIIDELCAAAAGEPRERIEADVLAFLRQLEDRGLVVVSGT
jgi:coenzyme PQQ biosynthesis protein PqqD